MNLGSVSTKCVELGVGEAACPPQQNPHLLLRFGVGVEPESSVLLAQRASNLTLRSSVELIRAWNADCSPLGPVPVRGQRAVSTPTPGGIGKGLMAAMYSRPKEPFGFTRIAIWPR